MSTKAMQVVCQRWFKSLTCSVAIDQRLQRSWKHQVRLHVEYTRRWSRHQLGNGRRRHSVWLRLEPTSRPASDGLYHI